MTIETKLALGGQDIGLLFGLPAIQYWVDYQKGPLSPGENITIDQTGMCHVLYAGYLNYCKAEAVEATLKFRFFYDAVETMAFEGDLTPVTHAVKLFFESVSVSAEKVIKKKEGEETEEKKSLNT